ncbi:MAG: TonB-dependent receptor [Colwellia sp.]|nr:TonB-dependent receptor [Colwellia sp.]
MKKYNLNLITLSILFTANAVAQDSDNKENLDGIETIIVTGQKIDRSLQETATSVAVITAKQIEEQQLYDFYDVIESTVNVTGDFGSEFTIRGINSFNVSGGGNSFLTSVYLDGAPLPERLIQQGGFSTWDASQVEFLRGPQSTLQGRNALAGAVVVNTNEPTYEWQGKGRLVIGEYGQQEAAIAFGGTLVEDQIAFRFSGEKRNFDGFNENITRNENSDFNNNEFYRLKVLFEPSFIENFSAVLSASHHEIDTGVFWTDGGFVEGIERGIEHRITTFDAPTFEYNNTDIYNLDINYELTDVWSLRAISTYSDAEWGYEWDGDATAAPDAILLNNRVDRTFSQELRFTFEYENLTGIVGAYYSDLESNQVVSGQRNLTLASLGVATLLVAPAEYGGLGLPSAYADVIMGLYADVDPVLLGQNDTQYSKVSNQALFADLTYTLTEQISIFAGLRWDHESQEHSSDSLYSIDNAHLLPDPTNAALDPVTAQVVGGLNALLFQQAINASGAKPLADNDFTEILPKVGASYHWTEDLTTSFTYQKGYRSGGVGTNTGQGYSYTYDPEYTDNYELSLRSVWLDGQLVANANLYYLDWQDQQISVQLSENDFDTITENAGSSVVKGFELELFYFPTNNLTITGGIGQANTEFKEFIVDTGSEQYDLSGKAFESPEWTANIAMTYQADSGWFVGINANYASSADAFIEDWTLVEVKEYRGEDYIPQIEARTLVNARIGYQWDNLSVFIIGKNILDEEYFTQQDSGGIQSIGKPRQLSVSLEGNF